MRRKVMDHWTAERPCVWACSSITATPTAKGMLLKATQDTAIEFSPTSAAAQRILEWAKHRAPHRVPPAATTVVRRPDSASLAAQTDRGTAAAAAAEAAAAVQDAVAAQPRVHSQQPTRTGTQHGPAAQPSSQKPELAVNSQGNAQSQQGYCNPMQQPPWGNNGLAAGGRGNEAEELRLMQGCMQGVLQASTLPYDAGTPPIQSHPQPIVAHTSPQIWTRVSNSIYCATAMSKRCQSKALDENTS